jgi:hypothetical protein
MTEHQPYTVVAREDGFEVRHYPDYVLAQVKTSGEFNSAASSAFRPLVSYISGRNKSNTQYAMTAPVLHEPNAHATEHIVSFVLPEGTAIKDLPLPTDAVVTLKHVKAHYAAAIIFRGLANYEKFNSLGSELKAAVESAGLKSSGDPYYARFDPPWKPGFLRHNEALIALAGYSKDKEKK